MSRAWAAPAAISWVTKLDLRSFAACSAVSMAASSTTPSCTRRCGRPPRPEREPPSAKEALSFMGLRELNGVFGPVVYPREGWQLSNVHACSHRLRDSQRDWLPKK